MSCSDTSQENNRRTFSGLFPLRNQLSAAFRNGTAMPLGHPKSYLEPQWHRMKKLPRLTKGHRSLNLINTIANCGLIGALFHQNRQQCTCLPAEFNNKICALHPLRRSFTMQVLCIPTSETVCDVECPCCKVKYRIYYSRQNAAECAQARETVRAALLEHHAVNPLPSAHPVDAFNVPQWHGAPHASGAALLSGAPLSRPSLRPRSAPSTVLPFPSQRRVS